MRPAEKFWEVPRYLLLLTLGMRHLSLQPIVTGNGSPANPILVRIYWGSIEWLLLWIALLAATVMLLASCGETHPVWMRAIAIGMPLIVAGMAWGLGRFAKGFRAGFAWLPVFLFVAASFLWPKSLIQRSDLILWSAWWYAGGQLFVSIALSGAFVETLILLGSRPWPERFARAAMTWIPFLILCGVAVTNWVAALLLGSKVLDANAHQEWQKLFLDGLRYDLFWSEVGTLGAVAITFGLLPAAGVAAYFSRFIRRVLGFPFSPGTTAHRMFGIILAVGPFALLAGGLVFWITFITGSSNASKDRSILEVYSFSALRLSGLLPFLLPFARNLLDVAADIIFFLQPPNTPLSSLPYTLPRLKKLLETLRTERPNHQIMVLAHSQGSVVAWTALREQPCRADTLITVGSPLTTLYMRLLGGSYGAEPPNPTILWKNIFRDGDYIGGEVSGCPLNISLGAGGHTGYWHDAKLVQQLPNEVRDGLALRAACKINAEVGFGRSDRQPRA